MFEIRLFGTPSFTYRGELWKIQRNTTRALLYFLASQGQPVGRSRLAAFFWPELPDGEARRRLRDHLGKLRTALPRPSLLITTPQTTCLNFESVRVDTLQFEKLQTSLSRVAWTQPATSILPVTTYSTLVQIVSLWQHPGFLGSVDFSFSSEADDWLRHTQHSLEIQYLAAIRRLVHHENASGNVGQAIRWIRMALEIDHLSDELNCLLLKALLQNDQQAEARKHYEYYFQLAERDGLLPLPDEIEALREAIFSEPAAPPETDLQNWPIRQTMSAPYVGQQRLLSQLDVTFQNGNGIIVHGEAGAGKTRLVQEFYRRLRPHPTLLLASCSSHEMDLPFYPWIELLRNNVSSDEWVKVPATWASLLTALVPELNSLRNDLPLQYATSIAYSRLNLFEAIHQLMLLVTQRKPFLLFIDDAHWADESSFDLLNYLLMHGFFSQRRGILVLTARLEEPNPHLAKFLMTHTHQQLEQIYLSQLEEDDVKELLFQVLGQTPPDDFIKRLARDSGGNPFFILETLQAILDSPNVSSFYETDSLPLSNNVHQLIQYRLQRLSSDANEILQLAAILGSYFDAVVLEQASEYHPSRFVPAMEELQAARLLIETNNAKKLEYAFVHEKIRESMLKSMTSLRAKLLHRKVAQTLIDVAGGHTNAIAAILAQHLEDAGTFSQAFDYWVHGATHAYRLTAINETLSAFNRAKRLITIAPHLEDEQIYELYAHWSDITFNLDDPVAIEYLNQELLEFGQERKSNLLIGAALDGLSDACFVANNFEQGLNFAIQATPYAQSSGNLYEICIVQAHHGVFLYMLGKFEEAKKMLLQAFEQLPTEYDENFINLNSNLHYQLGIVEGLMGYPVRGLQYLQRILEHPMMSPAPSDVMSIYAAMGLAYYFRGDFKSGVAISTKAIEMGERMEYKRMLGYALAYKSLNAQELGLLDEAWDCAHRAVEIGIKFKHHEIASAGNRAIGDIYTRLNAFEPAIKHYQQGVELGGEHYSALDNLARLGHVLSILGHKDGAAKIEQSYQLASDMKLGCVSIYAHDLLMLTHLTLSNQKVTTAELEASLSDSMERGMRFSAGMIEIMLAISSQDPLEKAKWLEKAIATAADLPNPWVELRALRSIIPIQQELGQPVEKYSTRILTLLDEIEPQVSEARLKSAWQNYRAEAKASTT